MKQYRVPFFTRIHEVLRSEGISLRVAYSDPPSTELSKCDHADLPTEFGLKIKGHWVARNRLLYQPLLTEVSDSDLVVVEQANKHILNLILRAKAAFRLRKPLVAFWGHGKNRQSSTSSFSERVKRSSVSWVDWWFAYTKSVSRYLVATGFPAERITTVCNSVDTTDLQRQLRHINWNEVLLMRKALAIPEHAPVGLFCGALYPQRQLDLLLDSAARVRKSISSFHLLIVGGGPEAEKAKAAERAHNWIHYLGPLFGGEKALCFRMSDIFLMPGLVGLAILDSFAGALPFFTTASSAHGPEIDYLDDGVNGFMVEPNARVYADTVIRVLHDPALLQSLKDGAARSANAYTIENMAENFRSGICSCLQHGGSRSKAQSAS